MSKKKVLSTYHILEREKEFLFVSNNFNAVFRVDKETKKITYIESIPEEAMLERQLVSKIIEYKNKIIFVPFKAKKIWIKDLNANSWQGIHLRDGENFCFKFFQAVQYNSKLYLMGCMYPSIICLDIKAGTVEYIDEVMRMIDQNCNNDEKAYFRHDYVQVGSLLYMASCKKNFVLKFDMQTAKFELIKVGSEENRYSGIAWDGECFWLSPRHGGVVTIWDGKNDGTGVDRMDFHIDNDGDAIRGIICDKNELCLLMNKSTYVASIKDLTVIRMIHEKYWIYECSKKTVRLTGKGFLTVYEEEKKIFETILELEQDEVNKNLEKHALKTNEKILLCEDEYLELTDFLSAII